MINRASVPMWGIAGKSAGPPKWAGKKFHTLPLLQLWRHGSDFIYTKNSAMGRSDCIYTKNSARPRSDFLYTHFFGAFVRFFKRKKASIHWKIFPLRGRNGQILINGATAGGRCVRKWRFSKKKTASAGYNFFRGSHFIFRNRGDDATENVNFQRRKQRLQGCKNFKLNFDEFKHLTILILILICKF